MIDGIELDRRFNHHPPDADRADQHGNVRWACKAAAAKIIAETPECREQSLAITALEEAMYWANAALARPDAAAWREGW